MGNICNGCIYSYVYKQQKNRRMTDLKSILNSKTLIGHLLLRLLTMWILIGLTIYLIFPLAFFFAYGSGATADRMIDLPISKIIVAMSPFLIGLAIVVSGLLKNEKKHNLSKAKSYIIIGLSLLILYPIRMQILDVVINIFTS